MYSSVIHSGLKSWKKVEFREISPQKKPWDFSLLEVNHATNRVCTFIYCNIFPFSDHCALFIKSCVEEIEFKLWWFIKRIFCDQILYLFSYSPKQRFSALHLGNKWHLISVVSFFLEKQKIFVFISFFSFCKKIYQNNCF